MDAERVHETSRELGTEVEDFVPLPLPEVTLFGAAANGGGRPLANIATLTASKNYYKVVVELPQVRFSEDVVDCRMNYNGDVTIIGQITPSAIFANIPTSGNRRNRVQLCPTEPWAISFGFPSPVDWWTASLATPSNEIIEISVRKGRPPTIPAASSSSTLVVGGVTWHEMLD